MAKKVAKEVMVTKNRSDHVTGLPMVAKNDSDDVIGLLRYVFS